MIFLGKYKNGSFTKIQNNFPWKVEDLFFFKKYKTIFLGKYKIDSFTKGYGGFPWIIQEWFFFKNLR